MADALTGRCFNTRLSEHKRDFKPISMAKLKEDDLNKKLHWLNIAFNYEHRINFVKFKILYLILIIIDKNF